jgi:hypothetical protein
LHVEFNGSVGADNSERCHMFIESSNAPAAAEDSEEEAVEAGWAAEVGDSAAVG